MPPRSAVEKSEHRNEIDDLLLEGKSPRFVSTYLKNKYNESISHTAINNYKKKHLNIEKEVAIEYQKRCDEKKKKSEEFQIQLNEKTSKSKKEKAVNKYSSDLEKLDALIDDSLNTTIDIERLENDPEVDQVKVEKLKLQKRRQGIDGINAKTNILKQAESSFEDNISESFKELADAIRKSKELAEKG